MDVRRLRAGEWIAAASGVLLAVCLFLPWYERGAREFSAWESFAVLDLVLVALALLAVGLLVVTAAQPTAAVGIAADAMLALVAIVVTVMTLIRLLNSPGSLEAAGVDATVATFGWVGLGAVAGVLAGAVVAMRDERLSRPGRPTDATGAPVSSQPEIETLPAPPREDATA